MKCPNCGTTEQTPVKVCRSCGEAYASQDLLELHQLEFLLEETAVWKVAESLRKPYSERLESLRTRLQRQVPAEPEAVAETIPTPTPKPEVTEPEPEPAPPPTPPPEPVPFDQWLLSERNIKLALYAGGALLVLAGLIFIGVNWTRIPGPGKFAITVMITGLMYLGGYLLYQRPTLQLGGIALLGVASGFLALNFAVLQIYVFGPNGLRDDVMWLIASPLCLLLYLLTAYWTRGDLFSYISLAAIASTLTAALVVIDAPVLVFVLAYALLALVVLALARALQTTRLADFTRLPLLIVAHVGMPLVIVAAFAGWAIQTGWSSWRGGSPWLALVALGVGVAFYTATDVIFKRLEARWAAAALLAATFTLMLIELDFGQSAFGITLMVIALAYLGAGYALERREERRTGAWPLYVTAFAVAGFVTILAIPYPADLANALIGDVVLLAVSAAIFRDYHWIYGAVWLFMLPVYLYLDMFVPTLVYQGLLMGVLGLNYIVAGYALGQREFRLGGPFLTAAAFLSIIVIGLTWGNPIVASLVLGAVATLYLLVALWIGWSWLLLPMLVAVNLAVLTVNSIFFESFATLEWALTVSYATLGVVLALGGLTVRRAAGGYWAWSLYLVGALDLAGAYVAGLLLGGPLTIALSVVMSILLLTLAWLERANFVEVKFPPILTYLGIAAIFAGHFYVIDQFGSSGWNVWPAYTAGLCGLFIALAWLLRPELFVDVYAKPLRYAGLGLMVVPMAGAVVIFEPFLGAVTFAIAGVTYAADAAVRRILNLIYLSLSAFVVVIWALLLAFDITEPQAYIIPLGLAFLGVGWNERLRGAGILYRLSSILGLIVLLGSAFGQSVMEDEFAYVLLLTIESLAALGLGLWTHTRCYVQLGGLALFANAIAQLGPGFVELPRWIQIAATGSILLGGGIAALLKREQILEARQSLTREWRQWTP